MCVCVCVLCQGELFRIYSFIVLVLTFFYFSLSLFLQLVFLITDTSYSSRHKRDDCISVMFIHERGACERLSFNWNML